MMGFIINSTFSQILFSEDFNYPTGVAGDSIGGIAGSTTALGDTIWKKHSGNSTNARCVKYTPNPLTFSGYSGSGVGGAATFQHTVGSADINGYIGTSITSGNVYAAFLLKIDSTGGNDTTCDYFFHYCDLYGAGSLSNFRGRLFICAGSDSTTKFKIGMSKGTAAKLTAAQVTAGAQRVYSPTQYNIGQTYLVVVKYAFNSGATTDDGLSLFVLPAGSPIPTSEPTPDVTFTDANFSDLTKIQSVCIRQGSIGKTFGTVDGFRVFQTWDATTAALLPIKLNSFNATGLKNVVNLNWSAICSENSCNFIVERSTDGLNFSEISNTNATSKGNYFSTDRNLPNASTLYYRIKIVNTNGKVEYSTVQKVQLKDIKLSVSPNPTSSEILVNSTANIAAVNVFDLAGKSFYSIQNNNTNSIRISVANLPEGTYVVKTTTVDGETASNKIVIKH